MEENLNSRNLKVSFAIGFTLGLALSIAVAVIFAPQSGRKTRALLKEKAADVGGRIREISGDRKKIYADTWKEIKDQSRIKEYPLDR